MKIPFIAIFILLVGCNPEPHISDKPISEWVELLEDLNPESRQQALKNLWYAESKDLEVYEKEIRYVSVHDNDIECSSAATGLLIDKLGDYSTIDFWISQLESINSIDRRKALWNLMHANIDSLRECRSRVEEIAKTDQDEWARKAAVSLIVDINDREEWIKNHR